MFINTNCNNKQVLNLHGLTQCELFLSPLIVQYRLGGSSIAVEHFYEHLRESGTFIFMALSSIGLLRVLCWIFSTTCE